MKNLVWLILLVCSFSFGASNSQIITAAPPMTLTNGLLQMPAADATHNGYLTSAKYIQFNNNSLPLTTKGDLATFSSLVVRLPVGANGTVLTANSAATTGLEWAVPAYSGTVTSVGLSVPSGSIFGVTGSPVTSSGTLGITTTGTSGGIPYFSSASQISSSAALTSGGVVIGGGAGSAPVTDSGISFNTTSDVLSVSGGLNLANLTASQAIFTDGSKNLVSNAITGTGNVVMSASPTLTGTITAGAANFSGAITASNLSGTNTGDVTLASFGSTPGSTGASLSGQVLTLQPASADFPGGVSTTTQTFAGNKTFSGSVVISGTLGVEAGTGTDTQVRIRGQNNTGTNQWGMIVDTIHQSGATSTGYTLTSQVVTAAASFTMGTGAAFQAAGATKGSGSSITRLVNFLGVTQTAGTNNAFLADNAAFSGNWFINSNDTNPSIFSGPVRFADGSAATPSITFASAFDMGFFRTGSSSFGVSTAGVQIATFNGTGGIQMVGSPTAPFIITGGIGNSSYVQFIRDGSGHGTWENTFASGDLYLKTNGNNRFGVSSAGVLTLGTAATDNDHTVNGGLALTSSSHGVSVGATTSATNIGNFRRDQSGSTKFVVDNQSSNSAAESVYVLSTNAGNLNIRAESTAGGAFGQVSTDSGFTGGLRLIALGTNPIGLYTNNTIAVTIDSSQNTTFSGAVKKGNYHIEPLEYDAGNSSTAQTIDWANGSSQKSTLTGNVTYTFSNGVAGGAYVLKIATGAGSFTATWPAAVKWSGGTAPVITTTASRVDLVNFYYDGTTWFGAYSQNYTP